MAIMFKAEIRPVSDGRWQVIEFWGEPALSPLASLHAPEERPGKFLRLLRPGETVEGLRKANKLVAMVDGYQETWATEE